jgi:hypothetical protein
VSDFCGNRRNQLPFDGFLTIAPLTMMLDLGQRRQQQLISELYPIKLKKSVVARLVLIMTAACGDTTNSGLLGNCGRTNWRHKKRVWGWGGHNYLVEKILDLTKAILVFYPVALSDPFD